MEERELESYKPRLGNLTVEEKIEEGETLKAKANLFFKRGDYKKALRSYAQVFAYVNGLSTKGDSMDMYTPESSNMRASEEQAAAIDELKVAVWSNMSLCKLKLDDPSKALEYCKNLLEKQPTHSKGTFRMAMAYKQLQNWEQAEKLLRDLATAEPKNASARKELQAVISQRKEAEKAMREKEKDLYGAMFSKK